MIASLQKGEIPDIDDPSEIFALSSPTSKSYSPSKVESLRMTEQDHQNRLSDYVRNCSGVGDFCIAWNHTLQQFKLKVKVVLPTMLGLHKVWAEPL